ncbi:nudix hydrolase chloroplastic-like [Sesbania bispinosa]|nr:nudix hydrolase chloroplastic-like [Sesbania bispinosa]
MSINLQFHAFAGNPLRSKFPIPGDPIIPSAAFETLNARIRDNSGSSPSSLNFKVLPFRNGMPLASSTAGSGDSPPIWHLGWIGFERSQGYFRKFWCPVVRRLVGVPGFYCSSTEDDAVYWAIETWEWESNGKPGFIGLRIHYFAGIIS